MTTLGYPAHTESRKHWFATTGPVTFNVSPAHDEEQMVLTKDVTPYLDTHGRK
jgi:hypothetical protein